MTLTVHPRHITHQMVLWRKRADRHDMPRFGHGHVEPLSRFSPEYRDANNKAFKIASLSTLIIAALLALTSRYTQPTPSESASKAPPTQEVRSK